LRFEDAVRCFQRALDIRRATLPAHDPRIPEAIGALATALYNGDQNEPARQLYNEVLSFGDATPVETRAAALEGLADLWIEKARNATPESARTFYANARDRYSASINSRLENRSEPGPDVARAMWGLAEAMDTLGEREEALTAYRRSLGILEKVYGEKHRDVAFGQFLLGIALTRRGQHTEAAEYLETAVAQLESTFGPSFPYTIGAKAALGRVLVQLGRYGESVDHLETAVIAYRNAGSESLVGTFGLDRADAEKGLARAYQEMGRTAAALELLRSSYEYWLSAGGESTARDFAAELARLFERVGRADSAAVYHTRAGISSRGGT
jgi:tetratricopeptide (TPR) repeat protein